ncbi:MAG: hypothetical protein QW717_03145 [Candidatus Bathyarchaeia archaeon]
MRFTIKALGWIITLLWIVALIMPFSMAFSLFKIVEGKNINVGKPEFSLYNGNLYLTIPFSISNTGFYDLTEININIAMKRSEKTIASLSKRLPDIPAGQTGEANCSFSTNLKEFFQKDSTLITCDAYLDVNAEVHFKVADAVALNVAANFTASWGAPFHNLTIYGITYNHMKCLLSFFISFDNHAPHPIVGPLLIELCNSANVTLGSTSTFLNILPGMDFEEFFEMEVNPSKITESVVICVYFSDMRVLMEEHAFNGWT